VLSEWLEDGGMVVASLFDEHEFGDDSLLAAVGGCESRSVAFE
jgi:hypothetical protein